MKGRYYKFTWVAIVLLALSPKVMSQYCIPPSTNGASADIYINGVQLNNLVNINTGAGDESNYKDYTSMLGEMDVAIQNELIVTATLSGNATNTYYHAWIDFNRDNDFNDAGEDLGTILPTSAGENMSFFFTAPSGAQDGPTRLRVTGAWGASILEPCDLYGYGETEDYTVALTGFEVIDSFDIGNLEPASATWADINNDGYLDVVYTSGWQIEIKQNNGDGTFTVIPTGFRPPVFGAIIPGDYDRDNDVDLLVTGKRANYGSEFLSYVLKNTGGSFTDINANLEPLKESSGDWGDFDNDGDLDILLTGLGAVDPVAKIYENIGNDEFLEYPVSFKGISQGDCQWFDFNSDGYLDVAVSGLNIDGNSNITIYKNLNGEGFSVLDFPFLNIMGVFDIGDYDQDGDQDIIVTGEENREPFSQGDPITALYRNNGDGTFTLIDTGIENLKESELKFGDADNDGDLDIFLSGNNDIVVDHTLCVYYNEGGDVFTFKDLSMPTVYLPELNLGDFDNDNDLDLVYVGHDHMLRIVENHTSIPNTAPSPPSWFYSSMIGNGINLMWERGYDNETSRRGLTYNLKVGTSSGAYDVVAPGSNPATGQLKFGNRGYLNQDSTVIFKGLSTGTYFWSIQSVDNSYSGSAFSTEQTIEVKEPFSEIDPGFPEVADGRSLWCDFNSDGNQDLILTGWLGSGESTTVWYNNAGVSFTPYANNDDLVDVKFSTVSLCDYDGDNDIDLMYYGLDAENQIESKFYENLGTSFSEIEMPYYTASGAEWGDVDNDGDADFIGRNSVLENDGLNNFSYLSSVSGYNLKAFDADNDGDLDIFSPQYGKIHFNDGTGAYTESTFTLESLVAFTSDIGDYNNDGYLDILVSGRKNSTRVSFVYRNNRDATFTDIDANIRAIESGRVSWVDYNNDGDLDVSMAGSSSTEITRIFINEGNNVFAEISVNLPENYSQDIDWADYDNDGDMDLIYMGRISAPRINNIYKNNNNFQNPKPMTPGGLSASIEGKKATLSWMKSTNPGDTIETMSYNVRIGTTPGGYDILAPQSHLSTGKPFMQNLGNAQMNLFKIIENLEVGTYYWSVHALDKNFKNSNWSTESSFVVNVLQADFNFADVCDGEGMLFTDASLSTGVTIDSWLYDFGDGNSSSDQNPSHVYADEGTYYVTQFITSGVFTDSTSKFVTVNKNSIPNFTSTIACQGIEPNISNTTDLNGLTLSSWHWHFGNGNTSSVQTPVNPGLLIAGDYNVKLTVTTSEHGCIDSISKVVTVSSYPEAAVSANGPLAFCDGDSVILSVAKNLAYDYYWKESGVNIGGQDSSVFYAKQTGDYTVEVVNPNGNCSKTSNEAYVYVPPSPASPTISASGPVVFCNGDSVILSVTDNTDHSYFWKRNGGADGIDSSKYIATTGGNYSLLIENSHGCTASSINTVTVTVFERPLTPTVGVNGQIVFCEGASVILSVTNDPLVSYQWMDGVVNVDGAATNTYTASTTGDYMLKITSGDGCEVETQVVEVIADPAPTAPKIAYSGDTEFCNNKSLILSVTDNPNYSYKWKLNGGTVGIDSSRYVANSAGEYTVEVQNLGGCSVTSVDTVTLTVHESPASPTLNLSGPTTFCEGGSLTLSISDPGTDSYQWISGLGEITDSTGTSIIIEESGLYKVRIRNLGLCEAFSQEISVIVDAYPIEPVILSDNYEADGCPDNDPVSLSIQSVESGVSYRWRKDGNLIDGATSDTYSAYLDEGSYKVEADNNGCKIESQSQTISYGEMPDKPTILAEGPVIWYLASSNDSATAYKWYLDGMLIEGADEFLYVAGTQEGKFEVAILENGSCFSKSDPVWIPLGTGIEQDPWEHLKIYPNPTPGIFTLEMDNHLMGELIIDIFGETGSKIINIKFHKETSHFKTQIDLSGQPPAAYLIGLMLDKYRTNRTLIVE